MGHITHLFLSNRVIIVLCLIPPGVSLIYWLKVNFSRQYLIINRCTDGMFYAFSVWRPGGCCTALGCCCCNGEKVNCPAAVRRYMMYGTQAENAPQWIISGRKISSSLMLERFNIFQVLVSLSGFRRWVAEPRSKAIFVLRIGEVVLHDHVHHRLGFILNRDVKRCIVCCIEIECNIDDVLLIRHQVAYRVTEFIRQVCFTLVWLVMDAHVLRTYQIYDYVLRRPYFCR